MELSKEEILKILVIYYRNKILFNVNHSGLSGQQERIDFLQKVTKEANDTIAETMFALFEFKWQQSEANPENGF